MSLSARQERSTITRILLIALLFLSMMVCLPSLGWAGGLDDAKAGLAAAQGGNYDEAIKLFTKAIESGELSQENLSVAYDNRGTAWDKKGDYDKAMADYDKAIEINPEYAGAHTNRGVVWYNKGYYDRAISDYTKAIELDPNYADAYNNRGYVLYKNGDYDKAVADLAKAIELDLKHITAYINLAWLMATCPDDRYRDGKEAVELAENALEFDVTAIRLRTLAAAYAEAGRFQDAIKTQESAIAKIKQEGNTKILPELEEHLTSYKAGKPWREK